jgi:DNA-binding beta-propeller fold protein YncE/cytochrome c553
MRSTLLRLSLGSSLLGAAVLGLVACPSDPPTGMDMAAPDLAPAAVLKRPSKSGTIAITDDDAIVGMVNPEDNSVSFFTTSNNQRLSKVDLGAGAEPWAIVLGPDNTTAYVANRARGTVVKISGINTPAPSAGAPVNVGSEPTGLALSPTAAKLYVAEYAEGRVGVIDTATMVRTDFAMANLRNPRAVAVTNNLDTSDADETVVVTEFFGEAQPGKEAKNDGRIGRVRLYGTDGSDKGSIQFDPHANTNTGTTGFETMTSPNQFFSVALNSGKVFVTSISASPEPPVKSDRNVYPVVYVGDLTSKSEDKSPNGSTNLATLVNALAAPRFFLADLVDIDFVPGSSKIAYAVSRGSDVVQKVNYGGTAVTIGAAQANQINVQGSPLASAANACHQPTGIAIASGSPKAYVNCWLTRRMAVLDLAGQAVQTVVDAATQPTDKGATTADENRGRHFFFTGRGRWSGNATGATTANDGNEPGSAWSTCGSCHPDGLTDNVTWIFAAGPRQSTSLDGSYSRGSKPKKQRIFNWTAIIDEMHDFEANTRGTSGGKGAITNAPMANQCGTLAMEVRHGTDAIGTLPGGLGTPTVKELQDGTAGMVVGAHCNRIDWDDIDEYAKVAVRAPKGRRFLDAAAVTRGQALFTSAGCVKCHGGAGWTVSRRYYTPTTATVNAQIAANFPGTVTVPMEFVNGDVVSKNTLQIQTQQPSAAAPVDPAPHNAAIAPAQLSCAIRNVGTFGVRMAGGAFDGTASATLEIKNAAMPPNPPAQGFRGYNVPSLYGIAVGAPFLHHGQAASITELFSDSKFGAHWRSGSAVFDPAVGTNRADLIAFLLSIDATTTELDIPSDGMGRSFELCP